jgi:hypothetical protein
LYRIVDPEISIDLPGLIRGDLRQFLARTEAELTVNLKSMGLRNTNLEEVLGNLRAIYGLGD